MSTISLWYWKKPFVYTKYLDFTPSGQSEYQSGSVQIRKTASPGTETTSGNVYVDDKEMPNVPGKENLTRQHCVARSVPTAAPKFWNQPTQPRAWETHRQAHHEGCQRGFNGSNVMKDTNSSRSRMEVSTSSVLNQFLCWLDFKLKLALRLDVCRS